MRCDTQKFFISNLNRASRHESSRTHGGLAHAAEAHVSAREQQHARLAAATRLAMDVPSSSCETLPHDLPHNFDLLDAPLSSSLLGAQPSLVPRSSMTARPRPHRQPWAYQHRRVTTAGGAQPPRRMLEVLVAGLLLQVRPCFPKSKEFLRFLVTSNLVAHA